MAQEIEKSISQGVATVRLNRPEVHNAFTDAIIAGLTETFRSLGEDGSVRVVVLASTGKSFCAGADLGWMQGTANFSREENLADAMALADMLRTIHDCPKPVIARVHGAAFGGGVGMVAACDMAVATSNSKFCLSEVKLGLSPATIGPFLMEKMGLSALRRFALTAERFSAEEARRIGLVHEVVGSAEEMDAWIAERVGQIKQGGPKAVAETKHSLQLLYELDLRSACERMAKLIADLRVSAEGQEGLKAFLEKRKPAWIE